jgi:hypothetical protein
MKLNDARIQYENAEDSPLNRGQKRVIRAIPEVVKSFTLYRVDVKRILDDEIECALFYQSSLCGVLEGKGYYSPQVLIDTKVNSHAESGLEITWVILSLSYEQDEAQHDLDAIPALQKYKRHTVKGYIQAVDRMARLLGWKVKK